LKAIDPLTIETIDGFKLNFEDGWLLVRPSGTEPKIRISVEARTEARARQIYQDGVQAIKNNMQGRNR
jgi:phosphomannomutase